LFDEGRLEEEGTHEDLLKIENGKYAHLFRLQSEGYAEFNTDKKASQIET
jgi:ATP-binding cassette, subfamily B, bacterial